MEAKIAFYLMTEKGFKVLENFLNKFNSRYIAYVVIGKDKKINKDFHDEIESLCKLYKINYCFRKENNKLEYFERELYHLYKIAISWRWIIKNNDNLIVLHDSILPRYRGFAPLVNSLINGEKKIGVTAILGNTFEYDKGDIIFQKEIEVEYPIKISKAIKLIIPIYIKISEEIFQYILKNKKLPLITQRDNLATYSLWLDEKDYFIDWSWEAKKIKRFVDAVGFPYDGAKSYVNENIITILEVEEHADVIIEDRERHIGKVIFVIDGHPVVVCGKGLIKIKKALDKDNKIINFKNFRMRFRGAKK